MSTENKQSEVKNIQQTNNTGDAFFQILQLTDKISKVNDHLFDNKKDHSSKRGLMKAVMHRKRLLAYLHKRDPARYFEVLKKANLRGASR